MATYDKPTEVCFASASLGLRKASSTFRSPYNGNHQAVEQRAERWVYSVTLPPYLPNESGAISAFLGLMAGGFNKVRLHHPVRLAPRGTMRGAPTLNASVSAGVKQIVISTTSGATLKAGDMIGSATGSQLFEVAQDCTAVGTLLTVPLVNFVRVALTGGSPILWDKPTALFNCAAQINMATHVPGYMDGAAIDFEEAY